MNRKAVKRNPKTGSLGAKPLAIRDAGPYSTRNTAKGALITDIDARAVQIAEVALWMKAAERAFGFEGKPTNLVAAVASHLKGPLWEEFLAGFEHEPSVARVLRKFGQAMEHIDELGSLARPDEDLRAIIHEEHATWERQITQKKKANFLFSEMAVDKLSGQLPFHEVSDEEFGERMLCRARAAIHAFTEQARQAGKDFAPSDAAQWCEGMSFADVSKVVTDAIKTMVVGRKSTLTAATLQQAIEQHRLAATHRPGRESSRQGDD